MKIIFFDTETTGGTEHDRLIQLAIKERPTSPPLRQGFEGRGKATKGKGNVFVHNAIYKPPVPISIESMAIHHITEKMAAEKPLFVDAPEYAELKELFEHEDTVAVAHNAAFDIAMMARENIAPAQTICTYKVARALDPEEKLGNYRLQYLRYLLGLEVEATAHDAFGDVLVLEAVFERLYGKMREQKTLLRQGSEGQGSEEESLREMIEISARPMLFTTLRFGKHKGKKIEDVARTDASYVQWLLAEKKKDPASEADWIYTLEHHLAQAAR